ncbi:FkbM family methyltransferase [Sphingomonas psychrotolerans]|uniref:FkbM family methyltransferase n=1 Tax=Sphingomonas psychrotolerans TaxID=1327635 RepID=A0A2K8MK95_9SPHN|nr:FkbM family methyltransferase [Sphingomonas psychrotolerans]ATY34297.1 FkbM family methyltransferase [Sphingomonas psychrotolerans]
MTLKSAARNFAEKFGLHVIRQSQNPLHHYLGLGDFPFTTIFDIGANEGQFAREARRRFPSSKLYCFEPVDAAYAKLKSWCDADGNAVPVHIALGDSAGSVEMAVHPHHTPSSSLLKTTDISHDLYPVTKDQSSQSVEIQRLDDFVSGLKDDIGDNLLLKLDVQGFEAAVLRGAPGTIARANGIITEICLESLYEGQSTFEEVLDLARAGGMSYSGNLNQVYGEGGKVLYIDAVFLRQ